MSEERLLKKRYQKFGINNDVDGEEIKNIIKKFLNL